MEGDSRQLVGARRRGCGERGRDGQPPSSESPMHEYAPRLDREARIAFEQLLRELRPFAWAPQLRAVCNALAQRPAVGSLAARDRPGGADELGPPFIASSEERCVG